MKHAALASALVLSLSAPSLAQQPPWTVAVLNVEFQGTPFLVTPEAVLTAFNDELAPFLLDASYGAFDLELVESNDIFDVSLPVTLASYQGNARLLMMDAIEYVGAGTLQDYDFLVLLSGIKAGGTGQPWGKVWVDELEFELLAQEFIHALNVPHSEAHQIGGVIGLCDDPPVPLPKPHDYPEVVETFTRGNKFDVMGSGSVFDTATHPNVRIKNHLGWLPSDRVTEVTQSGLYMLFPQDHVEPGYPASWQKTALRIPSAYEGRDYWVEFRQGISGTPPTCNKPTNADKGVLIYQAEADWRYLGKIPLGPDLNSVLLDMRPGTNPCPCDPCPTCPEPVNCPCEQEHFQWIDAALLPYDAETHPNRYFDDPSVRIELDPVGIVVGGVFARRVRVTFQATPPTAWPNTPSTITILEPGDTLAALTQPLVTVRADLSDAQGIESVTIELEASGSELPIQSVTLCDQGCSPGTYQGTLDMGFLPRGGYTAVVRVVDGQGVHTDDSRYFTYDPGSGD